MEPLKNLLERAWESLTEGWRELLTRSSGALTHFGTEGAEKNESPQEFPQWSLLAAETWETAKSVVIRVEIPGMNEGDLAIDVDGNVLRIRGEKRSGATRQRPGGITLWSGRTGISNAASLCLMASMPKKPKSPSGHGVAIANGVRVDLVNRIPHIMTTHITLRKVAAAHNPATTAVQRPRRISIRNCFLVAFRGADMLKRLRRAAMMAIALAASASAAAPGLHRIVHVCDCPASMAGEEREGLLLEFARLGYVQGRNLDLVSHDITTTTKSYTDLLQHEIAGAKTDLILASGVRVAQAARQLSGAPPVVFWRLTDPVGFGLVASLARPRGNLTGFSRAIDKLTLKRLELLHDMLPQARRVGFVFINDNSAHQRQSAEVLAAAPSLGLEAKEYSLPLSRWTPAELETLFATMKRERVEAFLLPDLNAEIRALIMLAEKYRLPTLYSLSHIVTEWGGLAAYATVSNDQAVDIVSYADRILTGTKPGDLPVQEPARFELIVNARVARDIGVVFSPRFLLRASQVIEK